jgi:hypothetical protein
MRTRTKATEITLPIENPKFCTTILNEVMKRRPEKLDRAMFPCTRLVD